MGLSRKKVNVYSRLYRLKHLVKRRKMERLCARKTRARAKQECINAYGGMCACCGEMELRFLTIDHKDGKGARHRKRLGFPGRTGHTFYCWLRKRGYPRKNYQALCFNCNCGRHVNGGICPHKEKR